MDFVISAPGQPDRTVFVRDMDEFEEVTDWVHDAFMDEEDGGVGPDDILPVGTTVTIRRAS